MSDLFLKIIDMSISASWLALAVLLLRLILKKAPKWVNVLLWGIVAVRLICPFALESSVSLIPDSVGNGEFVSEWADDYIGDMDFHHSGSENYDAAVDAGRVPISDGAGGYYVVTKHNQLDEPSTIENTVVPVLSVVWASGIVLLALYTVVSYWRLRQKVSEAVILRDNIYQSENVASPFVLGIIKPRVYLSYNMDEQDLSHVVAHEQAHIRRRDHWWKPLGFFLLTIHWFNPLMWLAYVLLCRDIELACDEKVIQELGNEQSADYSQALVSCSVNRRMIAACPLAFGEVGVKERVKSVMNYKKPAFWVIVVSVITCAVVAICFLTNPAAEREFPINGSNVSDLDTNLIVEKIADAEHLESASQLCVNADNFDLMFTPDFNWANDGAIRFFYGKNEKTYSAQLRMFHDDNKYFITERSEWVEQTRIFNLGHYLDALKYIPQEEVRQLSPDADGYSVILVDYGGPSEFERVLTYSPEGVTDLEGWLIHLTVQPLHKVEGGAYNGSGDEVIHLFYGHNDLSMLENDALVCTAESEGINAYIEPAYYMNGFDWEYSRLPWGEMVSSGNLVFTANWDTEELVVSENYYEETSPDSTMIHKGNYTLVRNDDGKFVLPVVYKNPGKDEMAVYFIRGETGTYVMKILFGSELSGTSSGSQALQVTEQQLLDVFTRSRESESNETCIVTDCVVAADGAYGLDGVVQYADETGAPWKLAFVRDGGAYPVSQDWSADHVIVSELTYMGNGVVQVYIENLNDGTIYSCTMEYSYDEAEKLTNFKATSDECHYLTDEEIAQVNEMFYPIVYDKQGNEIGVNPWTCFFTSY